jgi:hypothetical protein
MTPPVAVMMWTILNRLSIILLAPITNVLLYPPHKNGVQEQVAVVLAIV